MLVVFPKNVTLFMPVALHCCQKVALFLSIRSAQQQLIHWCDIWVWLPVCPTKGLLVAFEETCLKIVTFSFSSDDAANAMYYLFV